MKLEQIPPQDDSSRSEAPEQMEFDFAEAALRARVKELRAEHGWTEPYAASVARMELKKKKWEAQADQEREPK